MMEGWEMMIPGVCGFGLHFVLDGFRLIYTLIAVLMWTVSAVFSHEYMVHYENRRRYYSLSLHFLFLQMLQQTVC